ncbi:MAG TPA: VOC family protein [Streptosporangiaceae bacterium]|nr:VOC family protein [Streptosporangiaceae bacterium]
MPTFNRALHMALTVRDRRVSTDWYQRVLGFDFVKEFQVALVRPASPVSMSSASAIPRCGNLATRASYRWKTPMGSRSSYG